MCKLSLNVYLLSRLKLLAVMFVFLFPTVNCHAQDEGIKIGIIGALSGPKSAYGISHLQGAQLATEEINAQTQNDMKKLILVPVDDKGETGLVGNLVADLIYRRRVAAIMGSVDSGCTHVVSMMAVKAHIPHLTCVATDPSLTRAGSPWTFRTLADDEKQSKALIEWLVNKKGVKKISLIAVNSRYGKMGTKIFIRQSREAGCEIHGPFFVQDDLNSHDEAVAASLLSQPEAVVVWTLAQDGIKSITRLKRAKFRGIIAGGDGLASPLFYAAEDPAVEGTVITCPYDDGNPSLLNTAFTKKFAEKFGRPPDSFAAHAFDSIKLLYFAAIDSNGDRDLMRARLASTGEYAGVTGVIGFDRFGNDTRQVMLAQCSSKKLVMLKKEN